MELINFLEKWYESNCDGDWEHHYGIKIETLDNPGWYVEVDLIDTYLQNLTMEKIVFQKSETDWYHIQIKDRRLEASGDINKLSFILTKVVNILDTSAGNI